MLCLGHKLTERGCAKRAATLLQPRAQGKARCGSQPPLGPTRQPRQQGWWAGETSAPQNLLVCPFCMTLGDWTVAAQDVVVSPDCLNMLTRVLVAPPGDRMSMEDIKQHPWFLGSLPPGALDMNEFLLRGMEPFNLSMVPAPCLPAASARLSCPGPCMSQPCVVVLEQLGSLSSAWPVRPLNTCSLRWVCIYASTPSMRERWRKSWWGSHQGRSKALQGPAEHALACPIARECLTQAARRQSSNLSMCSGTSCSQWPCARALRRAHANLSVAEVRPGGWVRVCWPAQCEKGVDTILDKAQRVGYPGETYLTCPI